MKRFISLITVFLLLSLSVSAFAQEATLTVSGIGSTLLEADYAMIQIGAQTNGKSAADTQAENAQNIQKILNALKNSGLEDRDISTSQFSVFYDPGYAQDGQSGRFTVNNILYITVRDLSRISQILDAALQAGANNVYDLSFKSMKQKEAYHLAMKDAVKDAEAKAATLAAACGKTLGEMISISAGDPSYESGAMDPAQLRQESALSVEILSGKLNVSANVVIVYSLK